MEIMVNTSSYNQRRMGKPWIAKVDFSTAKGDFVFGDWTGDQYNGGAGVLSINAMPGEIIATGQKDNRQQKNSAPDFFVVTDAGALNSLGDKGDAYKFYLANRPAPPTAHSNPLAGISDADLIAEIIRRGFNISKNKNKVVEG